MADETNAQTNVNPVSASSAQVNASAKLTSARSTTPEPTTTKPTAPIPESAPKPLSSESEATILSERIVSEDDNLAKEVGLVRVTNTIPSAKSISQPPIATRIDSTANTAPVPTSENSTPPTGSAVSLPPVGINIHADIEKILREVKLPERRNFKAGADIPAQDPTNDAVLTEDSQPPSRPPTAVEPATMPVSTASVVTPVHTLKDDLQHAVKEKKMSLVRAVSLEQDKKARIDKQVDFGRIERTKRIARIIVSSLFFLVLGVAALFGVYTVVESRLAVRSFSLNSIVFAEQSVSLSLTNAPQALKQQVAAFRTSPGGSLGSITRIIPTVPIVDQQGNPAVRPATLPEFLEAFGTHPPDELIRALGIEFFFGVHVVDKNAPIIVATVNSYEHAFSGMLKWEETLNPDLAPAFTPVPVTVYDTNGIPSGRFFKDNIMRNYDVRELRDDTGQVQMYYSFPNSRLLVIAESPYSFPEILSRLQSERRL